MKNLYVHRSSCISCIYIYIHIFYTCGVVYFVINVYPVHLNWHFFRETSICSVDPTPGLSTPKDGILNTSCQLAWGTHCVICLFVCLFVCLFAPNLPNPSCSNALMVLVYIHDENTTHTFTFDLEYTNLSIYLNYIVQSLVNITIPRDPITI